MSTVAISTPIPKACIIGDSGIGKTSITLRWLGTYNEYNEYIPTYLDIQSVHVYTNETISICDVYPGGEYHCRLRPLYYKDCQLFIICFSVVDVQSMKSIKDLWIPEIKHYCKGVPYVICGTKIDLRGSNEYKYIVSEEEGYEFAKSNGSLQYFECSSKTTQNIDTMLIQIHQILKKKSE
ncbi:hypothetical protein DLAC_11671 [Tieghemostelium lacteum]|uniref:Rho GTPase n=1 Tax=Tieghemostelium lacteum TaxID=361077 RepID=A0A151ZDT4_TIELA|nr:hypothetical protein DLAC_11671 [Tieghemostelium lacteum]|eukprot:KYQ92079.1 hypothetical protein DLAC_11671 [Tieghemostelium lacteum]